MAALSDADMALVDLADSGKGSRNPTTATTELNDNRPENPPPYPGNNSPYPILQQPAAGSYPQNVAYPPAYPMNQPGYPVHQGYEHTVPQRTIIVAPVTAISCLGPAPVRMQCPYCAQTVTTMLIKSPSFAAIMSCMLMFLFLMWICCWIPLIMDGCKTTKHFCPNCKQMIGIYNP